MRLAGHERRVLGAAFAPGGRVVATAAFLEPVRLWDAVTGKELARCPARYAGCLAFSPDRRTLVTGHGDGSLLFWDVATLLANRPRLTPRPGDDELRRLGGDLAGADAVRAYRAIVTLSEHPKEAVPFLRQMLGLGGDADPAQLARLVRQLDDERFTARQEAANELARMGRAAGPALRRALDAKPSVEVRRRLQQLLGELEALDAGPEQLCRLRVVEILEHARTAEARELLRRLQDGAKPVAEEARLALDRLTRADQE